MPATDHPDQALLDEGTELASAITFMDRPLLELTHDELLAAAGFMFLELSEARQELIRLQIAIEAAGLQVVDVEADAVPEPAAGL
jgi:hypothetical protein